MSTAAFGFSPTLPSTDIAAADLFSFNVGQRQSEILRLGRCFSVGYARKQPGAQKIVVMQSKSPKPPVRALHSVRSTILVGLICLITVGSALGGFLIGRNATRDTFIQRINTISGAEGVTLISAGSAPISLYHVLGKESLDDPVTAQALAKAYNIAGDDREQLFRHLRNVNWIPPYRPVPFVGHMARPVFGNDLRINVLGFRDERDSYVNKPEGTVRIFLTGGSTAWGSGASSQQDTISYKLERLLNEHVGSTTGYKYEVINTAFPAWSTTQERILIEQRLIDMHPDAVLMFSGNNDVHWSQAGRDIRWYYSYPDESYLLLLNEAFEASGHPEWGVGSPSASPPAQCADLGRTTAGNVGQAAALSARVGARLIFALQPNIVSTAKGLTRYEQRILQRQNKTYWDSCYQALRDELGKLEARNYNFIDLSRSFGELDDRTELFIDSYHFADLGNRLIARALLDQIDWKSIAPGKAFASDMEPLSIIKLDRAGATVQITPNRLSKNLLAVLDQSVFPTVVAGESIVLTLPASLRVPGGSHTIHIVDGMTGETSQTIALDSR